MIDEYVHIDNTLLYVEENILGPMENVDEFPEIEKLFNSQLSRHCKCNGLCDNSCSCAVGTGGPNYSLLDLNYTYVLSNKDFETYPLIECNSLCTCMPLCGNRVVQNGPIDGLVVKDCGGKGKGIFTTKTIAKGVFICEYAGEVITKSTVKKRQELNHIHGKMNYIYCLNEHSIGETVQTFIDPTYIGNIGRYINHSCSPNCDVIPVRVDTPIPKLAIFSNTQILPGTEITFDYGFPLNTNENVDRTKCLCASENCRGFMPYNYYDNC